MRIKQILNDLTKINQLEQNKLKKSQQRSTKSKSEVRLATNKFPSKLIRTSLSKLKIPKGDTKGNNNRDSNIESSRTVSILPASSPKESEFTRLQNMLDSLWLVDPNVVKQFIKLQKKNEGHKIIKDNPDLELAISNLPEKYRKLALGHNEYFEALNTNICKNCGTKQSTKQCLQWKPVYTIDNTKSSKSRLENLSPKELGFQHKVLNKCLKSSQKLSKVGAYEDIDTYTKSNRIYNSSKGKLNTDIRADLDASGSYDSTKAAAKAKRASKKHNSVSLSNAGLKPKEVFTSNSKKYTDM